MALPHVVFSCALLSGCTARPIIVHWNSGYQVIDGFGASATGYIEGVSPALAEQFFSVQRGLGLSLLRIRPIAGTLDADCGCVSNNEPHHCVQGSRSQILSGDLETAKFAASRGVRLIGAPWSPPAEMKTSGKYCTGGSLKGDPASYVTYASQLASFLTLLRENHIPLDALSVQNEPDMENPAYDTCHWTGQQIHDFVPFLWAALNDVGFQDVKIAAPEQSTWKFDLLTASLIDPSVANKIGIVFGHAYGTESPAGLPVVAGRHVWQTEASGFESFNGDIVDGLRWARSIHNYMTIGANAWMYWSLACGKTYFNHGNNMCLTDQDNKLAKRAYVLGQFARFIRPGWQRIGVTNSGPLLVSAYRGPRGGFAVVALNTGRFSVANQPFLLDGSGSHAQVRPWVTSRTKSLEAQAPIALTLSGTAFSYSIPGRSVVTFEGEDN
jgi:glucuronoarabinoxylan endo-1,4-beta-xylanase